MSALSLVGSLFVSSLFYPMVVGTEKSPFSTIGHHLSAQDNSHNEDSPFSASMRKLIADGRARFRHPNIGDSDTSSSLDTDETRSLVPYSDRVGQTEEVHEESDVGVHSEEALRAVLSNPDYRPRFPVVYRYYGRNQALSHSYGSIPFLLLGPNVDHWKITGQELSHRGYNVVACERVLTTNNEEQPPRPLHYTMRRREAALLILQLLDALRWNKVVLVACDSETLLVIEAAVQLAPHRVAGVVLCGRLPSMEDLLPDSSHESQEANQGSVDLFLSENLRCPFTIVWDGAVPPLIGSVPLSDETVETCSGHRCLILGGGAAPHRRRPELLAWSLTRFVEKQISPLQTTQPRIEQQPPEAEVSSVDTAKSKPLPFRLDELLSPGSLLVIGRVIAKILFYGVVLKSVVYQYDNVRWGLFNIKAKVELIASLPGRLLRLTKVLVTFLPRRTARLGILAFGGFKRIPRGLSNGLALVTGGLKSFVRACLRDERVQDVSTSDDEDDRSSKSDKRSAKTQTKEEDKEGEIEESFDEDESEDEDESDSERDEPEPKRPWSPTFVLDQVIV